jgi:NAD(P)-dependent dehydrogenase (short-subunit alcohol dehydrogenase family)
VGEVILTENLPEDVVTTRRTPARRWGNPADFEAVAVYLASPSSRFQTGQEIVLDGGYSIF